MLPLVPLAALMAEAPNKDADVPPKRLTLSQQFAGHLSDNMLQPPLPADWLSMTLPKEAALELRLVRADDAEQIAASGLPCYAQVKRPTSDPPLGSAVIRVSS